MGQCKSGAKDIKSDYAKKKLRKNIGQCKSKERDFKDRKEDFRSEVLKNRKKKDFRRKVLKNCKGVRP
jgi:hypothetical protein